MQTVTMTLQVPIELKDAFMQAVQQEQKPASSVMLEMMNDFVKLAEEKRSPLYLANQAIAAGNIDEAVVFLKQVPVPPKLADAFKRVYGVEFLLEEGFNLSQVEEKYGQEWFTS